MVFVSGKNVSNRSQLRPSLKLGTSSIKRYGFIAPPQSIYVDGYGQSVEPGQQEEFIRETLSRNSGARITGGTLSGSQVEQIRNEVRSQQQRQELQNEQRAIQNEERQRRETLYKLKEERSARPITTATEIRKAPGIPERALPPPLLTVEPTKIRRSTEIREKERTSREKGNINLKLAGASYGIGAGESFVSTLRFGKDVATGEIFNIDKIPNPIEVGKVVGQKISNEPFYSAGFVSGEVIQARVIPKVIVKGSDEVRTFKSIEVPTADVVAPEFFKGQKYPGIKRGQTAGELLKEFKPSGQYGVTRLKGFTASSQPFARTTKAGSGSSEIKGVYQAPKISPTFLRVSSENERKLFGLNPFGTLRPTVAKIEPVSFQLAEGVNPRQTSFASLRTSKSSIESSELGRSTIPFIKSEKESIITAETPLVQSANRLYFKFERRKVPIVEFDVVPTEKVSEIKPSRVSTAIEVSESSSSGIVRTPVISSVDIASVSKSFKLPSSRISRGSSSISSSSVSRPSGSSSISSSSVSRPPSSSSRLRPTTTRIVPPKTPAIFTFFRTPKQSIKSVSGFTVSVRRYGKFKPVASNIGLSKAISIGKTITGRTLAASYKITPTTKGVSTGSLRTPRGYKRKRGGIFIEEPKYRLSTRKETQEIQTAKRIKI